MRATFSAIVKGFPTHAGPAVDGMNDARVLRPGKAVAPVPNPHDAQESSGSQWLCACSRDFIADEGSRLRRRPAPTAGRRHPPDLRTARFLDLTPFGPIAFKNLGVPVRRGISFLIGALLGNAGPTHSTEPETASNDRGTEIRPTGLHAPLQTSEPSTAHDIPCPGLRPGSLDNCGLPARCGGKSTCVSSCLPASNAATRFAKAIAF